MHGRDLISVPIKDLWIPNVVGRALQQAVDRVMQLSAWQLLLIRAQGASCYIYPDPFANAIGAVRLFAGGRDDGRSMAALSLRLYPVNTHGGPLNGTFVPLDTVRFLQVNVLGQAEGYRFELRVANRDAQLMLRLPMGSILKPPKITVSLAR